MVKMKAHDNDAMSRRFGIPEFRVRSVDGGDGTQVPDLHPTCSYCGSLTIDGILEALSTSGTGYSGADWKYGWPHKFYVDIPCVAYERIVYSRYENGAVTHTKGASSVRHHKFYATHLRDATPAQLEAWNQVAAPLLGVQFNLHPESGLGWSAACANYQTHGVVV